MAAADEAQALSLQWVYGLSNLPCNIINLSDSDNNDHVAYAAAHTAVLYDKHTGKQAFLQGHCNAITCLAASTDRSLLVTADAGTEASLLVFWDPATGQPVCTVQQPHAAGVLAIAVSADGQQLATLSAQPPESIGGPQEISLWDITAVSSSSAEPLQPVATTAVPAGDTQTRIVYNPDDPTELMTNGSRRAFFWRSQLPFGRQLSFYSPPLRPADFRQNVGDFLASVFVPGTTQALTSTVDGDVIVWEQQGPPGTADQQGPGVQGRSALKIIRLHGAAVRHLSNIGEFVVTGGDDGLVRLFDGGMRLCAWFEDMDAGPITCVSFATKGGHQEQTAMQLSRLSAPNFMVSTSSGKILAVCSETFNTPDPDNPSGAELLVEAPDSCLTHITAHPLRPELLLLATPGSESCGSGTTSSSNRDQSRDARQDTVSKQQPQQQSTSLQPQRLVRWDLVARSSLASRQLPAEHHVVRMVLARDGTLLALGCAAGHVVMLQGDSLKEIVALRHTKHEIERVSVSSDGRFVGAADSSGQVFVYGFLPYKGSYYKWDLVGKFKAHHGEIMHTWACNAASIERDPGPVIGVHFGEAPGGQTRLFSMGSDQRLVEYDLASCKSTGAGLRTLSIRDCAPPGGVGSPCAMCFAPPMPYYSHSSTETLLLVADDAFKIKAYNPDAASSCATATYLGPTFGGCINKLLPFRSVTDASSTPWLAYSTAERVVGLISWPLDCDPRRSMGLIAHPGEIRGLVLSYDGRKTITLGSHGIMNVWDVNTSALAQASSKQQPAGSAAALKSSSGGGNQISSKPDWAHLIGDPALLEELKDYFCYAQLTTQPLDTTTGLDVTGRVPVAALPDLMRAVGYYPSAADIDGLLAHVKFLADLTPADEADFCSTSGGSQLGNSNSGSVSRSHPKSSSGAGTDSHIMQQQKEAGEAAEGVDLDTFLLLYLSHRPVMDLSRQQIEAAFKTLGTSTAADVLPTKQLLQLLQTGGEPMSAQELQQALQVLTGAEHPEEALPDYMDADTFMTEILGFEG